MSNFYNPAISGSPVSSLWMTDVEKALGDGYPYLPYTYGIFKRSGVYYARNGEDGTIDSSNADFYTVYSDVIGALGSYEGTIHVGPGDFTTDTTIDDLPEGVHLRGASSWSTSIRVTTDIDIIQVVNNMTQISNIKLLCSYNGYTKSALLLDPAVALRGCVFKDMYISRSGGYGYDSATAIKVHSQTAGIERNTFRDIRINDGWEYGINVYAENAGMYCNGLLFDGILMDNIETGVKVSNDTVAATNKNSFNNIMIQCHATDTVNGVNMDDGNANVFRNVKIWDIAGGNDDILIGANSNDTYILGGSVDQNINDGGTNTHIRDVYGFVTENSGTATITNPATTEVVAHGLDVTPTVDDFTITLAENPTNAITALWVDTIGAANFTVNVEPAPGASNLDFGWHVRSKH